MTKIITNLTGTRIFWHIPYRKIFDQTNLSLWSKTVRWRSSLCPRPIAVVSFRTTTSNSIPRSNPIRSRSLWARTRATATTAACGSARPGAWCRTASACPTSFRSSRDPGTSPPTATYRGSSVSTASEVRLLKLKGIHFNFILQL